MQDLTNYDITKSAVGKSSRQKNALKSVVIALPCLAGSVKLCRQGLRSIILLLVCNIAYGQVPQLKEVTPNYGYSGQTISIKGLNFNATSQVFFGAAKATVVSQSDQLLEVVVPANATYNKISVTNGNGLTGYSPLPFLLSFGGTSGILSGNFETQKDWPAENGLYDLEVADLDGDGLNDVIASNSKSNYATILHNNSAVGNLSFTGISPNIGGVTLHVACGDLNGDGKPDVIFSEGDNRTRIFILQNNSTGPGNIQFLFQEMAIPGNSTKRIAISDLDLDGKPDLIITNQASNQISVLRNTTSAGNLTFDSNIINLTVQGAATTDGVVVSDMNKDGKPDIIVSQYQAESNGVFMSKNKSTPGNIQFSGFDNKVFPGALVNLKIGDLNHDGLPDLASTRLLNGDVAVLKNTSTPAGQITFADPLYHATNQRPRGLGFGDMDGDSKSDLLVATIDPVEISVNILQNTTTSGTSSFQKLRIPVTYINQAIKAADMDGDGRPDLVFASIDDVGIPASVISILRNRKCVTPKIAEEGPVTICSGNALTLTTQPVTGATYTWYKGSTEVYSGPNPYYVINAAGAIDTGDYTVMLEEGGCTETSDAISVTVKAGTSISPTINPVDPVCIGGTLTLSATPEATSGANKYVWRGPNEFTEEGNPVTVSDFQFSNSGKYYLDIFSGTCIVETKEVTVEAIPAPEFVISGSGTGALCEGDPTTLTISPANPDYTYQWLNASGPISGETSANLTVTTAGSYYASITDKINTSCPPISTEPLTVTFMSNPEAQYDVPGTICIGQPVSFTNQSDIDPNATAEYLWEFGDGTINTSIDPPPHVYQASGDYDIKLTVSYAELSCQDEITKRITVKAGLEAEIITDESTLCFGEETTLYLDKNYSSYLWSTGETTPQIVVTDGGNYSVTVNDSNGCEGSAAVNIQVFPAPVVTTAADKVSVAPGESVQLTADGLASYQWTPPEFLNDPSIANPVAVLSEQTLFTVTGTDQNGCTGSAAIEIFIQTDRIGNIIEPKNFFSPNDGDNINAVWIVEKIEQFPQCGVTILDQAGNILMEEKPYLNNWDGTVQGRPLPSGVYYYIIRCDGNEIAKSGSITLLR